MRVLLKQYGKQLSQYSLKVNEINIAPDFPFYAVELCAIIITL